MDDDLEGGPEDDRTHVLGCSPLIGLSGEAAQAKLKTKLELWRERKEVTKP
jgi:hypothetical protein